MSLPAGTALGVYEILGTLGAGGMGEVFRARDTKLARDVAIKILPQSFTTDPERVARFRREAQLLASLNHPNIGAIYGLEEAGSIQFLILELVDGESLASRIARGPLSLADALAVATDIALALEAAHEQGIVHRDLKPANVVMTKDGRAKVLDFGLAKAGEGSASSQMSNSPTLTFAPTQGGMILGTAAYMSPEQAKGQAADRRSDVWAFGCVLFEMLSGRKTFAGEDISDTIAAVLRDTPAWTALPKGVPAGVRRVIARCLEKNRRDRIPDISAARLLLDAAVSDPLAGLSSASSRTGARRQWVPWSVAAVLAIALAAVAFRSAMKPGETEGRTLRIATHSGAPGDFVTDVGLASALSPDGRMVALVQTSRPGEAPRLYVRRLDELTARPLAGTEGARNPFFSPDNQWIGFFAERKLKKIAVTGGAALVVADAPIHRGGAWMADGTILFQPSTAADSPLMGVPAGGGTASARLSMTGQGRWPQVLPGEKDILYTTSNAGSTGFNEGSVIIQSLSGGAPKTVVTGGYYGRYVPGHLLYVHDGMLLAVPFDVNHREVTGPPVTLVERLTADEVIGSAQYSISEAGILAYVSGTGLATPMPIAWLDSTGAMSPLRTTPAALSNLRFSPDGRRIAMDIAAPNRDLWIYDWARDTLSRLTADATDNSAPAWSPDGRDLAFSSKHDGGRFYNLYVRRADGTGTLQRLTTAARHQIAGSWHPSGRYLAFGDQAPGTGFDLAVLPLEGNSAEGWKPGTPTVFLKTPAVEQNPEFSPDGRWLAYQSDESGRVEVYVRPFPSGDRQWQLSSGGGTYPVWSSTTRAVYYGTPEGQIMEVTFSTTADAFVPDKPRPWSRVRFSAGFYGRYALHPDGRRFAIAKSTNESERNDEVTLVFNLFDELRRMTAPQR